MTVEEILEAHLAERKLANAEAAKDTLLLAELNALTIHSQATAAMNRTRAAADGLAKTILEKIRG